MTTASAVALQFRLAAQKELKVSALKNHNILDQIQDALEKKIETIIEETRLATTEKCLQLVVREMRNRL